jgi:hypothetical protein
MRAKASEIFATPIELALPSPIDIIQRHKYTRIYHLFLRRLLEANLDD